jgi:cytochrome c oxidase cbb3-type subunit III
MSDFDAPGWSIFVAIATAASLAACVALLVIAARRREAASDNTTGHRWDEDLVELNNPLPRWWMVLFVLTIVFSAGYLVLYPGLGSASGRLQWSSVGELQRDQAAAQAELAPLYARLAAMTPQQLVADTAAMGTGQRLFLNHCAQCHGSDARGSKGFPNLADEDWLWGGDFETIVKSVAEGRNGRMPPMAAAVGSAEDVRNVSHYVLSLSDSPHNSLFAQLGRSKFSTCAACHGANGKGNPLLGAPNLTDKIWLHGWGEAAIVQAITRGHDNAMPAQSRVLTPEQIRVVAAYVWGLSQPPRERTAALR